MLDVWPASPCLRNDAGQLIYAVGRVGADVDDLVGSGVTLTLVQFAGDVVDVAEGARLCTSPNTVSALRALPGS